MGRTLKVLASVGLITVIFFLWAIMRAAANADDALGTR